MRASPLSDRTRGLLLAAERKLTRLYAEPRITLSDEELSAITALVSAAIRTDDANRAALLTLPESEMTDDLIPNGDFASIDGWEVRPGAAIGWQPAATAPKDGTKILAWLPRHLDETPIVVIFWHEICGWTFAESLIEHGASGCDDFTNWRPMPEPPEGFGYTTYAEYVAGRPC